jgi:predicted AAA+ superfamily ATPase
MDTLFKKHRMLISQVSTEIIRDAMNTIKWDKHLVAIRGSRGVGKTTLMRQYIKKNYGVQAGEALYCLLDSMYFTNHSLLDLAENFHLMGGKHLFLDEVHKYPTWSKEIKEIIDLYPNMKIVFSGSSLLQILNADADLSRRVSSNDIAGLSFREFLRFYHKIDLPVFSWNDILSDADTISDTICKKCHPQPLFNAYLKAGYYPFFDGDVDDYYNRIENVVNFIIEQEMTELCGVEPSNTRKLKAMLMFLCNNVPYEVNIAKLASYLELNKATVLSYLSSMDKAELLNLLYSSVVSVTKMQKPDKIYIQNPNILYALCTRENIGTVRECFFVNQLSRNHTVEYGKSRGDFLIDGNVTVEVGGKDKSFDQIADVPNSYVFADEIEFPVGKKIPLYLAGCLY